MTFSLHPQLAADTIRMGELTTSSVFLMNDSRFPWLILVPRVDEAKDLIDLSEEQQTVLWREIDRTSRVLEQHAKPDKLNVAMLGNMVPQLHVHVIARYTTDVAWPAPVWGVGTAKPYTDEDAHRLTDSLIKALGISA